MRKILSLLSLLVASSFLIASSVLADSSKPSGITISPAFQQVSINSSESEHPVTFQLTNNERQAQTLKLSSADFNTLNESGGLLFVGTNPTKLQKKYGLAKWFNLPQDQVTIQPGETATFSASILNDSTMPAGGHYGALLVQLLQPNSAHTSTNVQLHPVASSLLFVTKIGGDTYKLSLADVSIKRTFFSLPSTVSLRFRNSGNTHLIPRGVVTVTDSKNKVIRKGIINDNSGIILPETYRQYNVPLTHVTPAKLFAKYKLRVDFRIDGADSFRSYQTSMYVISPALIIVIIIILLMLFILLYDWLIKKGARTKRLLKAK